MELKCLLDFLTHLKEAILVSTNINYSRICMGNLSPLQQGPITVNPSSGGCATNASHNPLHAPPAGSFGEETLGAQDRGPPQIEPRIPITDLALSPDGSIHRLMNGGLFNSSNIFHLPLMYSKRTVFFYPLLATE